MAQLAFVCLANSYRPGGHCVAGKCLDATGFGPWVRPVGPRPGREVSHAEMQYADKLTPKLLDLVRIATTGALPEHHQTENLLLDTTVPWQRLGTVIPEALPLLCDRPNTLWNLSEHTSGGTYNCITAAESALVRNSLFFIHTSQLSIVIDDRGRDRQRAHFGAFHYQHILYRLRITDPVLFAEFMPRASGEYPVGEAYLCVSLSHVFEKDSRCHKIIAAVLPVRGFA